MSLKLYDIYAVLNAFAIIHSRSLLKLVPGVRLPEASHERVLAAILVNSGTSPIVQSGVNSGLIVEGLGAFFGQLQGGILLGVSLIGSGWLVEANIYLVEW